MITIAPRLAFAGLRSRVLESGLLILLTGGAAAVIVLALQIASTLEEPWARTFDAAHGAHVLANVPSEDYALKVAGLPGVTESSGPIPFVRATITINGESTWVLLAGLTGSPRVNAPVQTEGSALVDGGVLFERSFARVLEVAPGEEIEFVTAQGVVRLQTTGTAVSPAQPRYPRSNPGLVWVTKADLQRIVPDSQSWHWLQGVRLADPAAAPAFASEAATLVPPGSAPFESWQAQREETMREADPIRIILTAYAVLLLLVSIAVVAILVGARVSGQYREIGLLKAIGLTPSQVSTVFVLEAVCLAMIGVLAGSLPAILLAPRLVAGTAATLVGSPEMTADPSNVFIAAAVVLPVVAFSAFLAARRSTRASVLQGLRSGTPVPSTRSRIARLINASRLPIPLVLGLRDMLARRTRAMWLMWAVGATSAAIVVTLSITTALGARPAGEPSDVPAELPALILTLDTVLGVITLSALVSVALLAVRERLRDIGVLRTVGLTPNEVTVSLAGSHVLLAFLSACLSIPGGLGLYFVLFTATGADSSPATGLAPWWSIALIPVVIALAAAIMTSIPARMASRISAADAVRME